MTIFFLDGIIGVPRFGMAWLPFDSIEMKPVDGAIARKWNEHIRLKESEREFEDEFISICFLYLFGNTFQQHPNSKQNIKNTSDTRPQSSKKLHVADSAIDSHILLAFI